MGAVIVGKLVALETAYIRGRPFGVWLLSILFVGAGLLGCLTVYAVYFARVPMDPGQRFHKQHAVWIPFFMSLADAAAGAFLFLRRSEAVALFGLALVTNICFTAWVFFGPASKWIDRSAGQHLAPIVMSLGTMAIALVYAVRLRRRGWLH